MKKLLSTPIFWYWVLLDLIEEELAKGKPPGIDQYSESELEWLIRRLSGHPESEEWKPLSQRQKAERIACRTFLVQELWERAREKERVRLGGWPKDPV